MSNAATALGWRPTKGDLIHLAYDAIPGTVYEVMEVSGTEHLTQNMNRPLRGLLMVRRVMADGTNFAARDFFWPFPVHIYDPAWSEVLLAIR